MATLTVFFICLGVSLLYYLAANVYLITTHIEVRKWVKESGLAVSTPIIYLENVVMEIPGNRSRPDIVSPAGYAPPPSYTEVQMQQAAPAAAPPPPYVK